MKMLCKGFVIVTLLGFGLAALVRSALAEIIVLQSNVDGIEGGSLLANDVALDVPKGRMLKVILPSGVTKNIKGPYKGQAGQLASGVRKKAGLWGTLMDLVTGGADERKTVGAVRSLTARRRSSGPGQFSWTVIPVQATGPVCIEADSNAIEFARPSGSSVERAIVIDSKTNVRSEIRWSGDGDTTAWPKQFAPRDGASYVILMAKQPFRQIKIVTLSHPLPGEDKLLAALHEAKCMHQIKAWVHGALNR